MSSLFTLGQGRKDEKSAPSLGLANADRLPTDSQRIHIRLGNVVSLHDTGSADGLVTKVDKGQNDADGKDPFGNIKRNGWSDGRGPFVKGNQLDGGEAVNRVDGNGDDEREPEIAIGKWSTTATGLEVLEVNVVPLLLGVLARLLPSVSATTGHGYCRPARQVMMV